MKRRAFITLLIASIALLPGCSGYSEFVVVNRSHGRLEVQYKLRYYDPTLPPSSVELPTTMSLAAFQRDSSRKWQDIPKGQYLFDQHTGTFTVYLRPQEVLLLDRVDNYEGHDRPGSESNLGFVSLTLIGVNGTTRLEGKAAQMRFRSTSNGYTLTYE